MCAHLSASRVIVQEGGDIVNFPVHCYPRILGGAVSCHILVAKLPVTQVQVVGGVIQRGHARMRAGERALDGEHHARTHTRTNARTRGGEDENERERERERAREIDRVPMQSSGPLHTRAKSRDHEIVREPRRPSQTVWSRALKCSMKS